MSNVDASAKNLQRTEKELNTAVSIIFLKLSKHVQQLAIRILKFSIFELKSLFISCEFIIPGVIAFYALLRQLKNHYSLNGATLPSHNRHRLAPSTGIAKERSSNLLQLKTCIYVIQNRLLSKRKNFDHDTNQHGDNPCSKNTSLMNFFFRKKSCRIQKTVVILESGELKWTSLRRKRVN